MTTKRSPPPSAHDVARLAGVSQAAVSRAFTPGASIATATREKVFAAARSLGYRPNLIARSLIKGRSGIVGVVIGNPRYPFFLASLHALSARLSRAGRHMLVYTAEDDENADSHVEDLLKFRVDALLLMAAGLSPKLARQCRDAGVPIIAFSRPPQPTRGYSSVTSENQAGAARIAAHLLAQGYRRFGLIGGIPGAPTSREREAGFLAHLQAAGVAEPAFAIGDFRREGASVAARTLLAARKRPDAIFCANDDMALAAIEVARFEFGLKIGRELGVAGFDDIELAARPSFDLTTYSFPVEQTIDTVMEMLLAQPGDALPEEIVVPGELKVRGSTRRR